MGVYDDAKAAMADLLAEFDQKQGDGTDPNDGLWYLVTTPGTGPADNPGRGADAEFKVNGIARGVAFKFVGGTTPANGTIAGTDMQAVIPVDSRFTPGMSGFMRVDGVRMKIIRIDKIPAAGVTSGYRLFFRK